MRRRRGAHDGELSDGCSGPGGRGDRMGCAWGSGFNFFTGSQHQGRTNLRADTASLSYRKFHATESRGRSVGNFFDRRPAVLDPLFNRRLVALARAFLRLLWAPLPALEQLDGLITNDKFCFVRYGRLRLTWSRAPIGPDRPRPIPQIAIPEGSRSLGVDHETAASMGRDAGLGRTSGGTAAVGSRLPIDPAPCR
jgi:hypothetical protein